MIELMIAMLIGILLLTGATGLFISNKRIYKEHDAAGRLQENSRFAINLLIKDIRMAAYAGCADAMDVVTNNITTTETDFESFTDNNAIEGFEAAGAWQPSTAATTGINPYTGTFAGANDTDGITLRYMNPLGVNLSAATTATLVPLADSSPYAVNQLLAVSDCDSTDIFKPTGLTGGLQHAGIDGDYDTNAEISEFKVVRYYIRAANDADGDGTVDPALYRMVWSSATNNTTTQELIEGVEDLEILYGVDDDADNIPDGFFDAANVAGNGGWDNVVTVKLAMLFRTVTENFHIEQNANTYTLLNNAANPAANDYRRRRVVSTTVQIRNRIDAG